MTGNDSPEIPVRIHSLRLAWDRLPQTLRRPIVWTMKSDRVRLTLLDKLGIRDKAAFITMSPNGLAAIDRIMDRVAGDGPTGHYYEFGLYRGYTLWHAQQSAQRAGLKDMSFFGFDSFSGLPEVAGNDKKAGIFISGDYACSRQEVTRLLTEHGFDWEKGRLIEGYFDQLPVTTKVDHGMGPAAVVMIDCDLYQSAVPALAFVADRLQDGTVIIFDDWSCFGGGSDSGEPRAFAEFLAEHAQWTADWLMDFSPYGKVFVIRDGRD